MLCLLIFGSPDTFGCSHNSDFSFNKEYLKILKDSESSKAIVKTTLLIFQDNFLQPPNLNFLGNVNQRFWIWFSLYKSTTFLGGKIGTSCVSHVGGRSAVGQQQRCRLPKAMRRRLVQRSETWDQREGDGGNQAAGPGTW